MIDSHMDFLEELAGTLELRGVKLLLIGDCPVVHMVRGTRDAPGGPTFDPPASCADSAQPGYAEVRARMAELAGVLSNVYFIDFYHLLCDSNNQATGNVPGTSMKVYADYDHLEQWAGFYLWPFVCDFFRQHGLPGP